MATFTVTSLDDATSGPAFDGSLREALTLAAANPGADTIVFAPAIKDGTIVLQEELVINDSGGVTIRGDQDLDGEIDVTISGDIDEDGRYNSTLAGGTDDARRIDATDASFLVVNAGAKATIIGVEFDHGAAVDDGTLPSSSPSAVIINNGNLTITDSKIDGTRVIADTTDGGQDAAVIYNSQSAKLTLRDVTFDDAYVRAGSGPGDRWW